jgi:hypothetical protein
MFRLLNPRGGTGFGIDQRPRLPGLRLQLRPFLTDRPITIPGEHPGEPLPYKLLVDQSGSHGDKCHGPAISVHVHGLHLCNFSEDQGRGRLFRLGSKSLPLLRAVDTVEADLLGLPIVKDSYRVTAGHAVHLAELSPGPYTKAGSSGCILGLSCRTPGATSAIDGRCKVYDGIHATGEKGSTKDESMTVGKTGDNPQRKGSEKRGIEPLIPSWEHSAQAGWMPRSRSAKIFLNTHVSRPAPGARNGPQYGNLAAGKRVEAKSFSGDWCSRG